jgi:hypothetical protein
MRITKGTCSMLDRIARALNQRIRVLVTAEDREVERLRDVFREVEESP